MEQSVQRQVLRELLDHLREGTSARADAVCTQNAAAYGSASRADEERAAIFLRLPLVAGLGADLPEAGSFTAQVLCGVPILLVRGGDGEVRAFLNACRHRGTRLVTEARGRCHRIVCPFHAWGYDLEGHLAGVPHATSFGHVDRGELRLVRLPVRELEGVIWIRLEPNPAQALDPELGDLAAELNGWKLAGQQRGLAREMALPMNWKLANDTFGETYHFEFLHRRTLSAAYHGNVTSYREFGRHHRMVFAARSITDLTSSPETEWQLRPHATIAYFLFPNAQLLISPRYCSLYRIFPDPERTDRCIVHQAFYVDAALGEDARAEVVRQGVALHDEVIVGEDFRVAASAQAALGSGLLPHVTFGRNEPALHHYRAELESALRAAAGGDER